MILRTWLDDLWRDVPYALRLLARYPLFSAAAIVSLALGIGANVAIFTAYEAVLLRTLPVSHPDELVGLAWSDPRITNGGFSYPGFQRFAARTDALASTAAVRSQSLRVTFRGATSSVDGQLVSGGYYRLLGIAPAAGRLIGANDDRVPGEHPVAVISYGYWQQMFGGEQSAIDQTVHVNGKPFRIVGVTPRGFYDLDPARVPAITLPLTMAGEVIERPKKAPAWDSPDNWWLKVIGRLPSGGHAAQSAPRLTPVFQQLVAESSGAVTNPKVADLIRQRRFHVSSLSHGANDLQARFATPLLALLAVVGLVLLIACANVANLMLGRMAARQREIGVRLAIGAGRGRIVRQILSECLVLAGLGAGAGLLLAYSLRDAALVMISNGAAPLALDLTPNLRVLVFTMLVAGACAALCGLAPAIKVARADLTTAVRGTALAPTVTGRFWNLGKLLVVGQIALCLILLNAAGLFVRTLSNLKNADVGFRDEGVLLFAINPQGSSYAGPRATLLYKDLLDRLAALPGVQSASLAGYSPLSGDNFLATAVVDGYVPRLDEDLTIDWNIAGPAFFRTWGTPLVSGREFTPRDEENAPNVAIVNERFARRFFGRENPLQRRFRLGRNPDAPSIEIVGVVKDVKSASLRDDAPSLVYRPYTQTNSPAGRMTFAVLTGGNPDDLASPVRELVRSIDPQLVITNLRSMSEQIDRSLHQERLLAALSSSFGFLALVLACVGLYGVMAYGVARRTAELSIRRALGATHSQVMSLVLRESALVVGAGVLIAVPAVIISGGLVRNLLYGLTPADPGTIAGAVVLVFVVGLTAAFFPARRAARLNPMLGLRAN